MSSQDTLISIGNQFKVTAATVMRIVNKVLYFVNQLKNTYIRFPKNEEEIRNTSRDFTRYPGTHSLTTINPMLL